MTIEYNTLLKHPRWFKKRKIVLARDNYKCRCCAATTGLHVHHRQYHVSKRTGQLLPPWEYQSKYLITLCDKCHSVGHSNYKVPTFNI
jgi:hypothetical protein